jgi:hypothetical protein
VAERRAPRWRSVFSWLCLVLFALAAPLALLTGWARLTVREEEVYARTVRDIATDARLQLGLAQLVTEQVERAMLGDNPTATDTIRFRAIGAALGGATSRIVGSPEFPAVWEAANRGAHRLLFAVADGASGQPVVVDLSPLRASIVAEIDRMGVDLPPDWSLDPEVLRVEVIDAGTANRTRDAVARLDLSFAATLAVAVAALVLAVAAAPARLAALARAGFALVLGMVVLIAAMVVTEGWLVGAAASAGGGVVVAVILDAVTQGLRVMAVALAVAGLLFAGLCGGLHALRRSVVRGDRG